MVRKQAARYEASRIIDADVADVPNAIRWAAPSSRRERRDHHSRDHEFSGRDHWTYRELPSGEVEITLVARAHVRNLGAFSRRMDAWLDRVVVHAENESWFSRKVQNECAPPLGEAPREGGYTPQEVGHAVASGRARRASQTGGHAPTDIRQLD